MEYAQELPERTWTYKVIRVSINGYSYNSLSRKVPIGGLSEYTNGYWFL